MKSQTGQEIITIHMLFNISESKDNLPMNFGQLIKYSMREIFLEKSCTKYGREPTLRPLYAKSKLSLSLDQQ